MCCASGSLRSSSRRNPYTTIETINLSHIRCWGLHPPVISSVTQGPECVWKGALRVLNRGFAYTQVTEFQKQFTGSTVLNIPVPSLNQKNQVDTLSGYIDETEEADLDGGGADGGGEYIFPPPGTFEIWEGIMQQGRVL
jgi:hypothetical protein